MKTSAFKKEIWRYYRDNGRELPWRDTRSSYKILVSEIMLQQTQVPRVLEKYRTFVRQFPSYKTLANAPQDEVLRAWQGLGYNRRALNLKRTAALVVSAHGGKLPKTRDELESLPGIGTATAGSLLAFAHNIPSTFIETNIRSVYLHFFFQEKEGVTDREIMPLIEQTLDTEAPREWYYALMDYGTHLKEHHGNPNIRSAHYKRQTPFKGSNREVRSAILKTVLKKDRAEQEIYELPFSKEKIRENIDSLEKEGFLARRSGTFTALS